ncbi:hypothetical protein MKEN_00561300 [Mycena kentingensis (nom. inval.)]|nr:hypothetical protein MKEN_00561300 [Mycena kentingensis (nom. inval.)]
MRADDDESLLSEAEGSYGYIPSKPIAIIFLALFGLSTLLHTGQAIYHRVWWLLPTAVLCGIGELTGWGARLWSALDTNASMPFTIQISTTIIAPTPLLAASFIIFSRVVNEVGAHYSLIPGRYIGWIFVPCDLIALVVQGVGGGIASSADGDRETADRGATIMLGGIGFQFAVIVFFSILLTDFLIRVVRDAPWRAPQMQALSGSPSSSFTMTHKEGRARARLTRRTRTVLAALAFSTTVLFIRSVYRTIELTDGWNGRIIHTELYFNVLDGGMVVLAIYTWNFVHPGMFLRAGGEDDEESNGNASDLEKRRARAAELREQEQSLL